MKASARLVVGGLFVSAAIGCHGCVGGPHVVQGEPITAATVETPAEWLIRYKCGHEQLGTWEWDVGDCKYVCSHGTLSSRLRGGRLCPEIAPADAQTRARWLTQYQCGRDTDGGIWRWEQEGCLYTCSANVIRGLLPDGGTCPGLGDVLPGGPGLAAPNGG
jgi:hypothetical protein